MAVGRSAAETTPVADRMVRDFVRCAADEPVDHVLDRVHRARINALPVQDGGRWTAQISRGELEAAARHGLGDRPVGEVASQALLWLAPSMPLHQANLELARARGRVVLVGEPPDRAVGLITRTTLLLAQAERSAPPHRRPPAAPLVLGMLRRALGPEAARVEALGALAAELGLGCFLVGGPVRDLLLGRPVRDIDVLVEGPGGAPALAEAAAQRFGGEVVHHAAFLTSKWRPRSGAPLDLATARAERYPGVAVLPEVRPAGVEQDLVRRDFTINAMAVDLSPTRLGRVLDPFGGWTDLGDQVLRVLHGLSFHDDPTRALRAARFAARFDLHLAPGTRGLLGGLLSAGSFARLGKERLGNELELIFNEPVPEQALRLLEAWGLMHGVHPGLRLDAMAFDRLRAGLDRLGAESPDRARLGWLWLASLAPAGDRAELSRMVPGDRHERRRFVEGPGRTAATASALRTARGAAAAGRALAALDRVEITLVDAILSTSTAEGDPRRERLRWWAQVGQATQTTVRGEALIAEGLARGPAIKAGLDAAQAAAWDGEAPEAQLTAAVEAARAFSRRGGPDPAAGGA
jgi:tRNA nucleotidyltransferase (CCA-adding enzyme)